MRSCPHLSSAFVRYLYLKSWHSRTQHGCFVVVFFFACILTVTPMHILCSNLEFWAFKVRSGQSQNSGHHLNTSCLKVQNPILGYWHGFLLTIWSILIHLWPYLLGYIHRHNPALITHHPWFLHTLEVNRGLISDRCNPNSSSPLPFSGSRTGGRLQCQVAQPAGAETEEDDGTARACDQERRGQTGLGGEVIRWGEVVAAACVVTWTYFIASWILDDVLIPV